LLHLLILAMIHPLANTQNHENCNLEHQFYQT
jgi:hypothetical protein